jgi:hypothetical protein
MTVAFQRQYPSSSPGSDGQVIPLEVSRPETSFSLCYSTSPMAAPVALDPLWDVLELWSNENCMVGFDITPVIRPDGAGSLVPFSYRVGAKMMESPDRILLTPPNYLQGIDPDNALRWLSVIGLSNPGELFVSVLTRYEAIAIDESLRRG